MIKIDIKKLHLEQLEVLSREIHLYYDQLIKESNYGNYLTKLMLMDLYYNLHIILVKKIMQKKKIQTLKINVSQAAAIMIMYNNLIIERTQYQELTYNTIKDKIDQQFKNIL